MRNPKGRPCCVLLLPLCCLVLHCSNVYPCHALINVSADDEDDDDQQGGSAVVQKKKTIGPSGPLGATTVNKDKKKEGDLNFAFESARTAVDCSVHA